MVAAATLDGIGSGLSRRISVGSSSGREAESEVDLVGPVGGLSGLPPAWIGVGSLDLFADEDTEYARRLRDADVPAISRWSRARPTAST